MTMSFLADLYQKSISETDRNLKFWEDYVNNLKSLDLNKYAEKLKVPVLVPIGSRILFRGELKHTNEVTVSLGADYFVKCSIQQAEILRQRRIQDAESKVDLFTKEKEYLEKQMSFNKEHVFDNEGKDIVEVYTEEEDRLWREKHKENVRKYKQNQPKEDSTPTDTITDEELWTRLEELELQEELENEMMDNYNEIVDYRKNNSFLVNEEQLLLSHKDDIAKEKEMEKVNEKIMENKTEYEESAESKQTPVDLLKQVLDKQNELENKITELKHREKTQSKTEQDLISKLDEMEQIDDLEDEMDRLEEILENGIMMKNDDEEPKSNKLKKSISFADEDDSETLELTFKHSDVEPNNELYNSEKGITKPSDIYEVYAQCFDNKTNSILKKSKYGPDPLVNNKKAVKCLDEEYPEIKEEYVNRTIVIKDIIEKTASEQEKVESTARPTSLFKKKRMQNKS